ncbi:hypothetical protein SAMN05892877_102159 [Rhizobium subbaraonis]|uniref:Uncharacterized protein n=1 Tax=Rhizobium subbaraonis TaxID=908946 RepID=A0A285U287_9HYPH|nr:hypothetical protein [Rhizobium subbaraonis]SOC35823.1 hypothetical protein SAMN05892877_102159 [Rhizobium subbaraonis]
MERLALRLYQIAAGKKTLVLEISQNGNGMKRRPVIDSVAFDHVELFDGEERKLRLSLQVMAGRFNYYRNTDDHLALSMTLPFPLMRLTANKARLVTDCHINIPASTMFAGDGSLYVQLAYRAAHVGGDAPGSGYAIAKFYSIAALAEAPGPLDGRIFGTDAPPALNGDAFPLPARLFREARRIIAQDITPIAPRQNFPNPRSVMIRPVGIRRNSRTSKSHEFVTFSTRLRIAPASAGTAGNATIVLDERDPALDTAIDVAKGIEIELIPDVFSPAAIATPQPASFYLRAGPLPPQPFTTIWNERIVRPYLKALRTINDASDVSFVPELHNVRPAKDASGDFEALYDAVLPDMSGNTDPEELCAVAIRPVGKSATFLADAVFPGLLTHAGKPVTRAVKVTVERASLAETFEWFDAPPDPAKAPEINVRIEAKGTDAGTGGPLRIGALDLDVPAAMHVETGSLDIRIAATFGSAAPEREHFATKAMDPKKKSGRARLPRAREAIPRLRLRIEKFELRDARPGAQDPVPDAARAFDAVLQELVTPDAGDDKRARRERRIARNLSREAPVVIVNSSANGGNGETPFFLRGEETTATNRNRHLALTLHRAPRASPTRQRTKKRTIVVDPEPFTVTMVDVPTFIPSATDAQENDGEIANWELSENGGAKWEVAGVTEGFDLYFTPQATGEAFEKGEPWPSISPSGSEAALDYRLGTVSRLALSSSYYRQRYAEAPWNVRRVLGFAGERAPGAGLRTARMEFLYGLAGRMTTAGLRLAEQGARIGAIRDPLPARPAGIRRRLAAASSGTSTSAQPLVEAELYDRFRDLCASFAKLYGTRLAAFEVYREGSDAPLSVEEKVAFELRDDADLDREPWNPESPSAGLRGGATRGFESRNIFEEVVKQPRSTRGQIVQPGFSALGGSGFVRAFFAHDKTRIVSDTNFGRTETYSVERIGRIGVFWNIAKHVIVYERTVLPHDQFAGQQAGQHFGRPIVRKAAEYIDIIQCDRSYPESGAAPRSRGFVEACLFRSRRIPVDSRWGRDVDGGWIVPLWQPDADPDIYPKPDIRLQIAAAHMGAAASTPARLSDPSQLVFFTTTRKEGDDPNLWASCAAIDFINAPPPSPVGKPVVNAADPDAPAPDDMMRDPLFNPCTFDLDTSGTAANLMDRRSVADPIGAVLENVTMMRSSASGQDGGRPGKALALRQELDRILADARRLERVLDDGLGQAQAALANLTRLGLRRPDETEIKRALDAEIDRLGAIKAVIRREAANARMAIGAAAQRAKDLFADAKSHWTDNVDTAEARLWSGVEAALVARADQLLKASEALIDGFDTLADGITPLTADVLARRIEEALTPVRTAIVRGPGKVGEALSRLDRAIAGFTGEMNAARNALETATAKLRDELNAAKPEETRALVASYDAFHRLLLARLDTVAETARRQLPRSIKTMTLFAGGKKTLDEFLNHLRDTLVSFHGQAIKTAQNAAFELAALQSAIAAAIDDAAASMDAACLDLSGLVAQGRQMTAEGDDAVAAFGRDLDQHLTCEIANIYAVCAAVGPSIDDKLAVLRTALGALRSFAVDLAGKAAATKDALKAATGDLLDELGAAVDVVEQEIDGTIATVQTAQGAISSLEDRLIRSVDACIAALKGGTSDLAAVIADAAGKLGDAADAVAEGLRQQVPASISDQVRMLEAGYERLSQAPTFQNPGETLALVRAAGTSPILPNLKFNRERIAYFFDDARDAIRTSPVVALMNRLDDDLKALGIRVPTDEILDRLVPKGMDQFDFGKLFPDLGGLKLDGLFKNLKMPASLNDKVKLTHGFDKATLTAWAKAEAAAPFPDRCEIFEAGPLELSMAGGRFEALADLAAGVDGITRRTTQGEVVGDWQLAFSGRPLVTLERTRVTFEDGKGLDVDIDPRRIRLDRSIQFLSDLVKTFSEPGAGFFLEMLEEEGFPAGLAARLDLPMPPLSFGAFSATGLRFSSSFALITARSGGKRGDFALSTTLAMGRKAEPFALRVWLLVGGGWLETRATYFPASGRLSSGVSIGLTAGLGIDFAFGPCRGFVYAMFGAYAEFESDGSRGTSFSIAVIFLLRGGIVILGRFNIGLSLLLELVYRDDGSLFGRGTIEVSFRICWCCEIKVRQSVTYHLVKSSSSRRAAAASSRPHYLDSFA